MDDLFVGPKSSAWQLLKDNLRFLKPTSAIKLSTITLDFGPLHPAASFSAGVHYPITLPSNLGVGQVRLLLTPFHLSSNAASLSVPRRLSGGGSLVAQAHLSAGPLADLLRLGVVYTPEEPSNVELSSALSPVSGVGSVAVTHGTRIDKGGGGGERGGTGRRSTRRGEWNYGATSRAKDTRGGGE